MRARPVLGGWSSRRCFSRRVARGSTPPRGEVAGRSSRAARLAPHDAPLSFGDARAVGRARCLAGVSVAVGRRRAAPARYAASASFLVGNVPSVTHVRVRGS